MEALIKRHLNRMQTVSLDFVRSMMDEIDWNERLLMIKGQKGVGKTTLMIQRIQQVFGSTNTTDVLYASLDNIYFSTHRLLDFIEQFHAQGGRFLFLDEVHKYKGWSIEVKNAYDEFEDMHIVLSGSSLINLSEGEADLSRRCITYTMLGLSFREYLRMFYQKDFRKRTQLPRPKRSRSQRPCTMNSTGGPATESPSCVSQTSTESTRNVERIEPPFLPSCRFGVVSGQWLVVSG